MPFDHSSKWKLIVQVHNLTKVLALKAEELDPEHEFYYPPLIQQRDAMDHIMRAAAAKLFPDKLPKDKEGKHIRQEEYIPRQLDKAVGHAYRALFDIADWLSCICRERIRETMSNYSIETIRTGMPSYRTQMVPRIEKISLEIADLRNQKDIGSDSNVVTGIEPYIALIEELEGFLEAIRAAIPDLEADEKKRLQSEEDQ